MTPVTIATEYPDYWGHYQRAYFDEFYYINIDDDTTRQGDIITMHLQLWHVRRYYTFDVDIIDGEEDYTITEVGEDPSTLYESESGPNGLNEMKVEVKTVGLEKANTLALYEANTTFTGHYQDINQRYAIIQLHIPDEGHYLGSESFLFDQVGNCSTEIGFIDSDSSGRESCTEIVEEIGGHTKVLRVQEQSDDMHADFYHEFSTPKSMGTIEWWWRSSKISGGILYLDIRDETTDVMRFYLREGKIMYHDGAYQNVMSASSNTWYHMKLEFYCLLGFEEAYIFNLYVNGTLKVFEGSFVNNESSINRFGIVTAGDVFSGYFDAFGFSWANNYDIGDNWNTYDCDGTPFEHGVNVIVIPTELFTKTLLHRYLEQGTLSNTPLYHSDRYIFEFVSNDRDGAIDEANSDVDFFFMRRNLSPEKAMDVLELVLKGLLNESLDESDNPVYTIGWINEYVSTKLNGTKATEMNLPYSVLGYIPWFNPYKSSKMGDEPEPDGGFDLILWLLCMTNPILNNVIAIIMAMTDGEIFAYLKEYCESVLMDVLTTIGDLMWTLIRAAILVFAYVLFAIKILNILLEYVMYLTLIPIIAMLGGEASYDIMMFEYTLNDLPLKTETTVTSTYINYFDLDLPTIVKDESMNNTLVSKTEEVLGIDLTKHINYGYPETNYPSEVYTSLDGKTTLSNINVNPNGGDTQTIFRFSVIYTDEDDRSPISGFPRLHVIHDGWVESERVYIMVESDNLDDTYTDGKEYIYEISYDHIGNYYFYIDVETPTSEIETDQYLLQVENLSETEILTSLYDGIGASLAFATIFITALGVVTTIPSKLWETIAALLIIGAVISIGIITLVGTMISNKPTTPFYALGFSIGLLLSASMFLLFCFRKPELSKEVGKIVVRNAIKFMLILIGSVLKLVFSSFSALYELDLNDMCTIEGITMIVQFPLLILACYFSSAMIFGNLDVDVEDITKIVAICSIISFTILGFLFLISALSPFRE